jgi:hypothetical protein
MESPMSVLNGEIVKLIIAPYRGSTTLEADVKMLVEGQEVLLSGVPLFSGVSFHEHSPLLS